MATEITINKLYKRVPESIVISGRDMDAGRFEISIKSILREIDPITKEPTGNYDIDPNRRTNIGGLEAIPEEHRQTFMEVIGQVIDSAWAKQDTPVSILENQDTPVSIEV